MKSCLNSVVAVFEAHEQAEEAIRELQRDGFDMNKLSIIGKDYQTEEHPVGYYNTGDRMLYWGKIGAFWGGFWALLLGSAFFWVPGIGPLLLGGPIVLWLVGALEEAAVIGGLGALGAALYSIGIPKNSIILYENEVKNGKLILIANGTIADVQRARELLAQAHAQTTTIHAADPGVGLKPGMTVQIAVEGRNTAFRLDRENHRWNCAQEQKESDFPLITFADGKRCELYSDGTFAEVKR